MMHESNWILFDEPTNHLDIVAKAELKRALQAYKGTVVLVSHEPDFYEDWVTKAGMSKPGPCSNNDAIAA